MPCAFIEIKPGQAVIEAEIVQHCRALLPGFKVPKSVIFLELPKTSTGRIQKAALRQVAGSARAIDVLGKG